MKRRIIGIVFLAAALCGGPAWAVQNVANTSQEGSLLIFPLITVDSTNQADTLVEITNFGSRGVQLECYYVNQQKGRVDFDFFLTPHATASWDVATLDAENAAPAVFPTSPGNPSYPGNLYEGELVCFAVKRDLSTQISFNHLIGSATVVYKADTDAAQFKQGFRYNAWSFTARGGLADNKPVGTPGDLVLSGDAAGTYDACPQFNVANFSSNGSTLGSVTTIDNDLYAVSCNQDLRQDYVLHLTKLLFTIWNANENSLTGAFQCADSVTKVGTGEDANGLTNASNFDFTTLRTHDASFQVQGIASTQCPGSENAGLLGLLTSSISINDASGLEDQELGSTTSTAGSEPGFVLWDVGGATPSLQTR